MQYILTHTHLETNINGTHKKNFVNDFVANLNIETSLSCHMQIIFKEITLVARFNKQHNYFTNKKHVTVNPSMWQLDFIVQPGTGSTIDNIRRDQYGKKV